MKKRPAKQMAESLWQIRRLLERLRNDPASSKLPVAYDFTDDHLEEGIARPIDELLTAIQAAKEEVAHVRPPQAERVVSTLAVLRERLMSVRDNASLAYGGAGAFGPSLEAAKRCMYRGMCTIWESYQAVLLDIACELETYGSLGSDEGRDRELTCASAEHKRYDDQGYTPTARPMRPTTMMHEEMLSLHRTITREIHKEHRDFFRGNWDRFCAWANETAGECQRYWMEQWVNYYKRPREVERRRLDRILDIQGEAQRRGEKDLVAKALECQHHLGRSRALRKARKEERRRLDFESQGRVKWDVRRNDHFGLFSWHGCIEMLWVPSDLVNPIGCIFDFEQAKDPTPDQRLLCDCAVLSVLHDATVQGADPRICPPGPVPKAPSLLLSDPGEADYFWQFNIGDRFVWQVRAHLAAMTQDGQIQATWDRVKGFLPQDTRDDPRSASLPIPRGPTHVNTQSMKWDVFISHASEDKEAFVRPLAKALQRQNIRVWYDEFTLTVGDSLRRSIDHGLASSRYGIVVISPSFLAKEWPQKELDGLAAREVNGRKVILPIWHNVDALTLRQRSPLLADRVATSTAKGVQAVVADLMKAMQ